MCSHLKNAKNIAYPLIKFKDTTKNIYTKDLFDWILGRMYDLDNLNNVSEEYKKYEPEGIVHFDDNGKGTLEININRNETLIKEKLKNINNTKNEPIKLIIFYFYILIQYLEFNF